MNRLSYFLPSQRPAFSCLVLVGFLLATVAGWAVRAAHAEGAAAGNSPSVSQDPAPVREAVIKTVAPPVARGASSTAQTSPAAESDSARSASDSEPRILRGNDRVLAPAPRTAAIAGPATALRFEEAPVTEVVHVVFDEIVKADYVIHPPVAGTITLSTRSPIPPDQILLLLEATLQANGIVLARDSRGVYHIGKPDVLRGIVSPPRRVGSGPLPPGMGTVIVPLEFVGAAEMAEILRPVAPGEAIVRVDTLRNLLILAGTRTQIEGWLDLVATFDVDLLKGMSVGVFPLKYARVAEVEAALRMMTSSGGGAAAATPAIPGRPGVGIPQQGQGAQPALLPESNPLYGAVRILPLERLNSILVVTPRASYLDQARTWIERLDRPSDSDDDIQLYIYPVQNGSARHLATVLNGIFGSDGGKSGTGATGVAPGLSTTSASTSAFGRQGGGTGSVSGFGSSGFGSGNYGGGVGTFGGGLSGGGMLGGGALGNTSRGSTEGTSGVSTVAAGPNVRIVADEINNAILIYGSKKEYNRIENSLRRLDIAPVQVLIEASIVEITLSDDLKYGLQWYFQNNMRSDWKGIGILKQGGAAAGDIFASAASGFSYSILNPAGQIRAVLNALAEKSLLKVISSPSLMVLDNHPASIIVGNQQPVQTGTSSVTDGGVISTSIQYKDTGVALNVIPSVNAGNIVTMEILQSVTDVGADIDEATKQRPFMQREISSKVAVRSGETLVLGGLIRDNNSNKRAGVPILHDLPVLGHLFGGTTIERERTELVVIITPRVVRSDQDVRDVSDELRERMKGLATLGESRWPARRSSMSDFQDSTAPEDSTVPGNATDSPDAAVPADSPSFPDHNGVGNPQ